MISDTLADAVVEIDDYLASGDPAYDPSSYMIQRVRELTVAMDELRSVFDSDINLMPWPQNDDEYRERISLIRHYERRYRHREVQSP